MQQKLALAAKGCVGSYQRVRCIWVHVCLLAVVVSQWRTEMPVKLGLVNCGGGFLRSGRL